MIAPGKRRGLAPGTPSVILGNREKTIKYGRFASTNLMQELGPKDLLGRRVLDDKGSPLGYIKGIHQLRMQGAFEEVTIQNGKGLIFARIDELTPSGEQYVLANGYH
jgi:hypothetical protein